MKNYRNFINEKLSLKQNDYIKTILSYLKKNTNLNFFEYAEEFIVNKKDYDKQLTGKLYLISDGNRAIRFNFDKESLISIDEWSQFRFDEKTIINKPSYTLNLNGISVLNILDKIVKFVKGDFDVNENNEQEEIKKSSDEKVELKSILFNKAIFEQDIDIFEAIKLYTAQVAYKISNSLVISGLAGLGKTFEVTNTLNEIGADYTTYSGDISTAGLYEILFLNRNRLLLLDDIDSVFDDSNGVNLLKAALDTKPNRTISRAMKTYFDSDGMSDKEIWNEYERTKKLPKKFTFTGRVIFITNVPGKDLDGALITRSLFVDVNPSKDEIIKRIYGIIPKIQPTLSIDMKKEVVDFMLAMDEKYELTFPLNLRTFVHCLNIRISNEFKMTVGGESIFAWMLLIKQFLTKKD